MAYAYQLDSKGFIWWYRENNIKGSLKERFEEYIKFVG